MYGASSHDLLAHDLLASHGAFLRALARNLVRDTQRAEDLVQDTFAAALTQPPARSGDLRGWLATALLRRASNLRRGEARRALHERCAARAERVRGVDTLAAEVEFSKRLATHVEALAPPLCEALFLRYFEDLPPRRIAARLGVPVSTVKSRLERGLAELRSRLDADAGGRREEWLGAALVWSAPSRPAGLYVALGVATLAGVALIATGVHRARVEPPRASALANAPNLELEAAPASLTPLAPDERDTQPLAQRVAADVERETLVLRGVVEDLALGAAPGTGQPAAGGTVWFPVGRAVLGTAAGEQPRPSRLSAVTDSDGRFELTVTSAEASRRFAQLWVEGNDELRGARTQPRGGFHAGNASEVHLRRYPWGPLEGRVVDTRGVALAGVSVRLRGGPELEAGSAVSAHDGRFRFERVRSNWAALGAEHPGRELPWSIEAQPLPRGGFEPVEVVLAELATLRIRTGAAGTSIAVLAASSERDPEMPWNPADSAFAAADAEGVAVIDEVPAEVELEVCIVDARGQVDALGHFRRRRADQLVAGLMVSTHDTQAIAVAAGETLELVVPPPTAAAPQKVATPQEVAAQLDPPTSAQSPGRAQLHVEVVVNGAEPGEVVIVHQPIDLPVEEVLPAPPLEPCDDPSGWPRAVQRERSIGEPLAVTGATARGVIEVPAGPGWLAATGSDIDGLPLTLVGTGRVLVPSGEVRVQFVLGPTAKLAGSIPPAEGFEPCVALQDARGRAVWLRTEGETLVPIIETGARGRYVLRDVPAGPVTLLVGSREELERGEPRWTENYDFAAPK